MIIIILYWTVDSALINMSKDSLSTKVNIVRNIIVKNANIVVIQKYNNQSLH